MNYIKTQWKVVKTTTRELEKLLNEDWFVEHITYADTLLYDKEYGESVCVLAVLSKPTTNSVVENRPDKTVENRTVTKECSRYQMSEQKIAKIINEYEMTGAYIEGAKRHEYKHYDKTAKENMVRALNQLLTEACMEAVEKYNTFAKYELGFGPFSKYHSEPILGHWADSEEDMDQLLEQYKIKLGKQYKSGKDGDN